ncbi:hypothetical protein HGRIS_000833 [Hohenbuehelia grisea]|uniref:Uncharacterized protein n=1 Tax=Hohenbuehelia grisea TaxID=104357 RepID=A0ABR3IPW2_9AGAR
MDSMWSCSKDCVPDARDDGEQVSVIVYGSGLSLWDCGTKRDGAGLEREKPTRSTDRSEIFFGPCTPSLSSRRLATRWQVTEPKSVDQVDEDLIHEEGRHCNAFDIDHPPNVL